MVEFLGPEVSFEEGCFKLVAKLNFLKFYQWSAIVLTLKVLMTINSSIVFSSACLIPF